MGTPLQCPPPCLPEPPNQSSSSSIFSALPFIPASPSLALGLGSHPNSPRAASPAGEGGAPSPPRDAPARSSPSELHLPQQLPAERCASTECHLVGFYLTIRISFKKTPAFA